MQFWESPRKTGLSLSCWLKPCICVVTPVGLFQAACWGCPQVLLIPVGPCTWLMYTLPDPKTAQVGAATRAAPPLVSPQGHTFKGDSDLFYGCMNQGLTLRTGSSVIHWTKAWKGRANATGCLQYYLLQGDIFACLLGKKSSQNLTQTDRITVTFLLVPIHIHAQ